MKIEPLKEANALIILGGLATSRFHFALTKAEHKEEFKKYYPELAEVANMTYEEALNVKELKKPDGPFVKCWQENKALGIYRTLNYSCKFLRLFLLIKTRTFRW